MTKSILLSSTFFSFIVLSCSQSSNESTVLVEQARNIISATTYFDSEVNLIEQAETITSFPISRSIFMKRLNIDDKGEYSPTGIRGGKMNMVESWSYESGHTIKAYKQYTGVTWEVAPEGSKVTDFNNSNREKEFDGFYILNNKGKVVYPITKMQNKSQ